MTGKKKPRPLAPLRFEDAPALRRFAQAMEFRGPNQGFAMTVAAGIAAKTARLFADRLEAEPNPNLLR